MAQYALFEANDGECLAYQTHGQRGNPLLILIHGFTGSSEYFHRNIGTLSTRYWVIAPDLRGHGRSTRASHGYHVPRLAADLRDLLDHLSPFPPDTKIIGVGCSLGAAVLWVYTELFSGKAFASMVFVDQAPLQDYIPGSWSFTQGNYGVHDATSLASAQATLHYAPDEFYRGLVQGCLAYRYLPNESEKQMVSFQRTEEDESFFTSVSRQGDPWWFGKLLANHTSYDHRDTIKNLLTCPCLVMAGKRSGSFPIEGIMETAKLVNSRAGKELAKTIVMESGHWMFYEEAEDWSRHIVDFVESIRT